MQYYYKIFGLTVESDIKIQLAYEISYIEHPDVIIKEDVLPKELFIPSEEELQDRTGFAYRPGKNVTYVRSLYHAVMVVEKGNIVRYQLKEGYDPLYLNQLILCLVFSVIYVQRGNIGLHGSGLLIGGKAIAICGESGAGKSTFADGLLNHGAEFMADDMVGLAISKDGVAANAGFPYRKLCLDAATAAGYSLSELKLLADGEKKKVLLSQLDNYHSESEKLDMIVVIEPDDVEQVTMKEITGASKFKYIVNNIFRRVMYTDIGFEKLLFTQCVLIAKTIPVFVIKRPKEGRTVEEMSKLLLDHMSVLNMAD